MNKPRNTEGEIPDDHFENEPTYPPKNVSPLSKEMLEWLEKEHGTDKYGPGDVASANVTKSGEGD